MAIESLELKIAAERAILAAKAKLTPVKYFAMNFGEAETAPGTAINVPVFDLSAVAEFEEGVNDFGSTGEAGVTGVDVPLDKYYIKTVSIRPEEIMSGTLGTPNQNYFNSCGEAIGRTVAKGIVDYTLGLINETNVPLSASFTASDAKSKEAVADLHKIATETMDCDAEDCVVLLNPTCYSKLLGILDWQTVGDQNAIRGGDAANLFGFDAVIESTNLPEGLNGAIVHKEAIAMASRPQKIYFSNGAGEAGVVRDEVTGLALNFVKNQDWKTQRLFMSGTCYFGAKIVQPNKICRLIG